MLVVVAAQLVLIAPVLAEPRTLRIGTGDWVPYVDSSRADAGAMARLVRAVLAEAGHTVEFVFYPWERNMWLLQQGQLDAIMPYSCSPTRQRHALCSEPLVQGEMVLFHRQGQAFDWQRLEDLARYRIGVTHGYSYGAQFDAAVRAGQLQVERSSKADTGFRLLQHGRIDLHLQDRAVGYALLRGLFPEGATGIVHHARPLNSEALRMLFRKDDEASGELLQRFNASLRRFAERGDLARLQQALYHGEADDWQPTRLSH